eukprot:5763332-Pyramimonas_sp.AAC.1
MLRPNGARWPGAAAALPRRGAAGGSIRRHSRRIKNIKPSGTGAPGPGSLAGASPFTAGSRRVLFSRS